MKASTSSISSSASSPVTTDRRRLGRVTNNSLQQVVLIDENDQALGVEEKLAAHQQGLLHRAVSVFILDHSNRLLMQQRALGKYHSAGLWSNTCCGHPEPGETPLDAAKRRLRQEMNIDCDLVRVGGFVYRAEVGNGLIEHEYDHVFVGRYDNDPVVASDEAETFAWVTFDDLNADVEGNPGRYTKWFPEALSFLTSQGFWGGGDSGD
jgi:isopentenyl-diphosphate Delta-isomerase